jgi:hypothetical protein
MPASLMECGEPHFVSWNLISGLLAQLDGPRKEGPMSDARWNDPREYGERDRGEEWPRVYEDRDRDDQDPRDALMGDLDWPTETV